MVLFFIAFYAALFSSKHFHLELFVRSLFTQLFYLVVLFLLLLSMTAFSHVKAPFSLVCVTFFLFLFLLGRQLFPYWFYSHQFAELRSIHRLAFLARACSLAFLCLAILFLAISRAVLINLVLFSGLFQGFSVISDFVDFSFSKGLFLLFTSGLFRRSFSTALFFLVQFFLALRI